MAYYVDHPSRVFHCSNRCTDVCAGHYRCLGTSCKSYKAIRGSYHSYKENDPKHGYLNLN